MNEMNKPIIVHNTESLRAVISKWKSEGQKISFVPTMGALHEGHLSLVRIAEEKSDKVVVSIFVNPTQFAPHEDFDKYPRQEEKDIELLADENADLVFIPNAGEMYPQNDTTAVKVGIVSENFEGEFRPGHFEGVATVVLKLLLQVMPDFAVFGEKDFQQLAVIRRMCENLFVPVEIIGAPIARDEFGLALSSRNAYLSEESLNIARGLNRVISDLAEQAKITEGNLENLCEAASQKLIDIGFEAVDYLSIVDEKSLEPIESLSKHSGKARILVTARIQGVRLLDNMRI